MSWNVLITARVFDVVGQPALDLLRQAGCQLVFPPKYGPLQAADLMAQMPGIDAVLCSPDQYSAPVLSSPALAQLKIISRWGVGYDSVDVTAATAHGIVIAYTPGLLNNAVADYTFALLLGIARRIHCAHVSMTQQQWLPQWGHDVAGKTIGIIGCGRIGQGVARRARGFDMRVLAYDVVPCPALEGVAYVSLDELLAESDFVSLHAALTPQSRGLIGATQLRRMKKSAYLINTARGQMIDEPALVQALHEGWIAGAALDVFEREPLPSDHPFRSAPNLLLAPHQASFGRETADRVCLAAAQAIINLMQGQRPTTVVNPVVFDSPQLRARLK